MSIAIWDATYDENGCGTPFRQPYDENDMRVAWLDAYADKKTGEIWRVSGFHDEFGCGVFQKDEKGRVCKRQYIPCEEIDHVSTTRGWLLVKNYEQKGMEAVQAAYRRAGLVFDSNDPSNPKVIITAQEYDRLKTDAAKWYALQQVNSEDASAGGTR